MNLPGETIAYRENRPHSDPFYYSSLLNCYWDAVVVLYVRSTINAKIEKINSSETFYLLAVTLGTTYVDDHVKTESASMYIGCIYSMAAFGPVLGFLLGAYLLSFHMDSFSGTLISISKTPYFFIQFFR